MVPRPRKCTAMRWRRHTIQFVDLPHCGLVQPQISKEHLAAPLHPSAGPQPTAPSPTFPAFGLSWDFERPPFHVLTTADAPERQINGSPLSFSSLRVSYCFANHPTGTARAPHVVTRCIPCLLLPITAAVAASPHTYGNLVTERRAHMGYKPPHLRGEGGGASQSSPSPARANGSSSGYERPGMRSRAASSASLDKEGGARRRMQCPSFCTPPT